MSKTVFSKDRVTVHVFLYLMGLIVFKIQELTP